MRSRGATRADLKFTVASCTLNRRHYAEKAIDEYCVELDKISASAEVEASWEKFPALTSDEASEGLSVANC